MDDANQATSNTYDIAARLLTRSDARTIVTTYAYHPVMKDLSAITYSDSTPSAGYTYDRLGRPDTTTTGTIAKLVRAYRPDTLAEDTQTTTYDTNGSGTFNAGDLTRVLTRQYTPAMPTRSAGYALTPVGSGVAEAAVTYDYEPVAGRVSTITAPSSAGIPAFGYTYVPARPHLLYQVTAPTHTVTNTWEPNRDVLDLKVNSNPTPNQSPFSEYDYTVNAVGQRTAVSVAGQPSGGWTWGYDDLGQVNTADSTISGTSNDRIYKYDTIGNRRVASTGLSWTAPDNYSSNLLNQITTMPGGAPGYDLAGNMTSDGSVNPPRTYQWDAENRLKAFTVPTGYSSGATYRYDAYHRRISKTTGYGSGTTTQWFIYDGWNLIAEYLIAGGNPLVLDRTHTWGVDLSGTMQGAGGVGGLLATDLRGTSPGVYYPTYDGNGNVSEYLKRSGTTTVLAAAYSYDPFGNTTQSSGAQRYEFTFRFSTKFRDSESEFYYYGYRYYSAVMGRWINRDIIQELGGLNLYGIVKNNLVAQIDVLGWFEGVFVVTPMPNMTTTDPRAIDILSKAGKTTTSGFQVKYQPSNPCSCREDDIILVQAIQYNGRGNHIDSGMTDPVRRAHLKRGGLLPEYPGIGGHLWMGDAPNQPHNNSGLYELEVCALCTTGVTQVNMGCVKFSMNNRDENSFTTPPTRTNNRPIIGQGSHEAVGPSSQFNDAATSFMTP